MSASEYPINTAALPALSAVRVGGEERLSFLQGQLTQDMQKLPAAGPLYAGWTSAKGRLLCAAWVFDWQQAVWLILPTELAAGVAQRLGMFVLRTRVDIAVQADCVHLADPVNDPSVISKSPDIVCINNCFYNDKFFGFYPDGEQLSGLILTHDRASNAMPEPHNNAELRWRAANIQAGRPLIFGATREEFIPQMVNLDLLNGISFTKGCYVGQEIVARTQNLGRIKRRMFRFGTEAGHCSPGDAVYHEGKAVGKVVDAVAEPGGTRDLLAVIQLGATAQTLSLDEAGTLTLQPRALPYTIPEADTGSR